MKREEILVNCIDEIQSGKCSLESCMAAHPELARELKAIVRIIRDIDSEAVAPTAEFKQRARNRLLREIASTEAQHRQAVAGRRLFPGWRLGYTLASIVLALAIGSTSVAYASQNSLPSDTLYPVKTGVEKLQVALAFSPESRANLHLKLAGRRIQEVADESASGRDISASALAAAASQIDGALKDVNEMPADGARDFLDRLSESTQSQQATLAQVSEKADEHARPAIEQAIKTTRRGNMIARVASSNPSLLNTGVSVHDDDLEATYFEIEGDVVRVEGQTWNIGGIELNNVNAPGDSPGVGNSIKLYGIIRNNETYIGKIEHREEVLEESKIKGVYTGKDTEGKWSVSGIPVGESDNVTPPPQGDEVEVKGKLKEGVFNIERSDSHKDDDDDDERDSDSRRETESRTEASQTPRYEDKPEENTDSQQEYTDKDRREERDTDQDENRDRQHGSSDYSRDDDKD